MVMATDKMPPKLCTAVRATATDMESTESRQPNNQTDSLQPLSCIGNVLNYIIFYVYFYLNINFKQRT